MIFDKKKPRFARAIQKFWKPKIPDNEKFFVKNHGYAIVKQPNNTECLESPVSKVNGLNNNVKYNRKTIDRKSATINMEQNRKIF